MLLTEVIPARFLKISEVQFHSFDIVHSDSNSVVEGRARGRAARNNPQLIISTEMDVSQESELFDFFFEAITSMIFVIVSLLFVSCRRLII